MRDPVLYRSMVKPLTSLIVRLVATVFPQLKALLPVHDAIFLATCNAILPLGDVKLANTSFHHSLLIYFKHA